jgi:hypothetical protein
LRGLAAFLLSRSAQSCCSWSDRRKNNGGAKKLSTACIG